MTTKSNPRFGEIVADLEVHGGALLHPWEGECWRFQVISHPHGRDILSGKGALQKGADVGTRRGLFGVLHDAAAIGVMLGGLRE